MPSAESGLSSEYWPVVRILLSTPVNSGRSASLLASCGSGFRAGLNRYTRSTTYEQNFTFTVRGAGGVFRCAIISSKAVRVRAAVARAVAAGVGVVRAAGRGVRRAGCGASTPGGSRESGTSDEPIVDYPPGNATEHTPIGCCSLARAGPRSLSVFSLPLRS